MENEAQLVKEFEADNEWFHKNLSRLQSKHSNMFVAVKGEKVIAASKDFESTLEQVEKQKIDTAFVLIEFVTEKGTFVIL